MEVIFGYNYMEEVPEGEGETCIICFSEVHKKNII